jgi:hypothetical protein
MNDKTRRWLKWPMRSRILALAVGIGLLTAACGGSTSNGANSSSSTGGSSSYQRLLSYSACMRSHGVPDFPDPGSNGGFVFNGSGVSQTALQAAQKTCQRLLPNNGQSTHSQSQQDIAQGVKFSQCMRAHGVSNFPDPSSNGATVVGPSTGVNPQSQQFQTAQEACKSLMPKLAGGSS